MTPEEKAREIIDRWLTEAGWQVVDRNDYEPTMNAVAVREMPTKDHLRMDYVLILGEKAIGVIEAKKEDIDVSGDKVSEQVATYARKGPAFCGSWENTLPFLYKSNGKVILFQDYRESQTEWERLNRIHKPKELVKLYGGIDNIFAGLPMLNSKGLRNCQYEAIKGLEKSFRNGKKRALLVLATGAGKTYTACMAAYRLLNYTPMRRVLFLVDRNNLGKQAESEFGSFRLTENGETFSNIFTVNRLHSSETPTRSNVVISTIQRLFALIKGEAITDTDDDDSDTAEHAVEMPDKPRLPHDFFDLIIIDECHRSIYGNWKAVLDYFDTARKIGLTATPTPETLAFFDNNRVANYTLEKSIADGVNVPCRIYRIKTEVSEEGGAILQGDDFKELTKYTGEVQTISNKETKHYTREELNRSVINPSQIMLILKTYRDAIYTEMYTEPQRKPDMRWIPKTLIFALNEAHASNIVKIARDVFGEVCPEADMSRYVQKITYSAGDSNGLIRLFRNDKEFRIAVTCTLVATGTDVKPLEVLIFMRDVWSITLYTQMKGRGVRTISDEALRNATPNATSKDYFYLVDAVGVTEHEMFLRPNGPDLPFISLHELLERLTHGEVSDGLLADLVGKLSRIDRKLSEETEKRQKFTAMAGISIIDLAASVRNALESGKLPPYNDINDQNLERKEIVAPLTEHANVRRYLLALAAGFVKTLMPGTDTLISKGFSTEQAKTTTEQFEQYCAEHADDIEALRIIYNQEGKPITYALLKDLENKLKLANNDFEQKNLWNSYALVQPDSVKRTSTVQEADALTNLIQLVRFAYHQTTQLMSSYPTARQFFNLWCGQKQLQISAAQREVVSHIVDYIASNGACTVMDIRKTDATRAAQMIVAFGDAQKADKALASLFNFVVLKKTA